LKAKQLQKELDVMEAANNEMEAANNKLITQKYETDTLLKETRNELTQTRMSEASLTRQLKLIRTRMSKVNTFYLKVVGRRTMRRIMTRCVNNFRRKWFAHRLHLADPDNLMTKWELAEARAEYCEEKATTMMKQLLDTEDQATELAMVLNSEKKVNGRDANIARSALVLEQQRRFFVSLTSVMLACTNVAIAKLITQWRCKFVSSTVEDGLRSQLSVASSKAEEATRRAQAVLKLPETKDLIDMKFKASQHGKLVKHQKQVYLLLLYALYEHRAAARIKQLQLTMAQWGLFVQRIRDTKKLATVGDITDSSVLELRRAKESADDESRTLKVELSKATHSLELEKQMVSQLQEQLFTGIKDSVATAQKESLKAEHAKAAQQMAEKKIRNVDQMASAVKQEKDQAMGVILLQKREIEEGRVQTKAVEAELYQVHNQCSVMEKTERDIFNAVIASHAALLELGATIEERDAKSGYPSDPSVVGCIKSDTEYMQQLARQLEVKQRTDRLSHIGQETNDNLPQSPNQSQSPSPGQNLLANNPADAFFISQNPFESSASNPFLSQSGVELGGVPSPVQKREPRALSRNRGTLVNRAKTNHGPRKIGGIPRDVLRGMGSPLKSKTALLEDNMSPHSRANALPPLALVNLSLI